MSEIEKYRDITRDSHSKMAGVTMPSFVCAKCNQRRRVPGRKQASRAWGAEVRLHLQGVRGVKDKPVCLECGAPADWKLVTQFAGSHPYCDKHAHLEPEFGCDDSYGFWVKLTDDEK